MKLWRYNPVTGYWILVRIVSDETAAAWLATFQADEPTVQFKLSRTKPRRIVAFLVCRVKVFPRLSPRKLSTSLDNWRLIP